MAKELGESQIILVDGFGFVCYLKFEKGLGTDDCRISGSGGGVACLCSPNKKLILAWEASSTGEGCFELFGGLIPWPVDCGFSPVFYTALVTYRKVVFIKTLGEGRMAGLPWNCIRVNGAGLLFCGTLVH